MALDQQLVGDRDLIGIAGQILFNLGWSPVLGKIGNAGIGISWRLGLRLGQLAKIGNSGRLAMIFNAGSYIGGWGCVLGKWP